MRRYLILLFLFPTILFCNNSAVQNRSAIKIYKFLKESLPKKSHITFLNITNENRKLIEQTQDLILKENYFSILDRRNLSDLAKQAMLQDEPHFLNSKSHKFLPSDWAIFVKGKTTTLNLILKKIIIRDYFITIDSIKDGTTKNIYHLSEKQKVKVSVKFFLLTLLITTIIIIYIHFLTKGYYRIFIIFIWLLVNFLIFYLYFFI